MEINLVELTRSIHKAMCEVSHHDSSSYCHNARKYEIAAQYVWSILKKKNYGEIKEGGPR